MSTIFDPPGKERTRTSWKSVARNAEAEAQRLREEMAAVRAELDGAHKAAQTAIQESKRLLALVDAKIAREKEYKARIAELETQLATKTETAASAPRCGRPRTYGAADAERVRHLLDTGHSFRETARLLGCSLATVQRLTKM